MGKLYNQVKQIYKCIKTKMWISVSNGLLSGLEKNFICDC